MVGASGAQLEAPGGTIAPSGPRRDGRTYLAAARRIGHDGTMEPDELARALANTIASGGPSHGHIRILVRGGRRDRAEFDAAFLEALAEAAPWARTARVEIVHPPVTRVCSECGHLFESAEPDPPCPDCGGEPFEAWLEERIAYEID